MSGKMRPPDPSHLSRAKMTESSIPSVKREKPIHSDTMMSTVFTGSSTSSTSPWMMVTTLSNPLSRMICLACMAMLELSTPNTCLAPVF